MDYKIIISELYDESGVSVPAEKFAEIIKSYGFDYSDRKANNFEETVLAFEETDSKILFTGDSNFTCWGERFSSDFTGFSVVNRGFGGSTFLEQLYFLNKVILESKAETLVISCGGNDIACGFTKENVLDILNIFILMIRQHALHIKNILYLNLKKRVGDIEGNKIKDEANVLLEKYCKDNGVNFVEWAQVAYDESGNPQPDKFCDGVHVKDEVYANVADILKPLLIKT